MRKLTFIVVVIAASVIAFACQPPKPGGFDAPSKNNPNGEMQEIKPQKTDSSVEKSVLKNGVQDTTKSK